MDIDCGTDAGGNGCNCRSPAADQLILWGFDKVFLGTLEEGRFRGWRLKLTPLPVNPPVKNLIASSAAAGRLALVGEARHPRMGNLRRQHAVGPR